MKVPIVSGVATICSEGAKPGQIPTKFRDVVLTSFLTNTFEVRLLPPFIRRIKGSLFVHEFLYFSTISNFHERWNLHKALPEVFFLI